MTAKPESSKFNGFWMPPHRGAGQAYQVRHDDSRTFYETIIVLLLQMNAPSKIVISASRRTDIPAFYMPWFMNQLGQGHFEVVNPFNRKISIVPSTSDDVHTIVFWSKNFGPFISGEYGEKLLKTACFVMQILLPLKSPHEMIQKLTQLGSIPAQKLKA